MGKKIAIQKAKPGMVINKVTKQNGPVKIKKSGLISSQDMLQGLIEMGVCQIEIDPEQTVELTASKVKKSPTQKMLENNQRLEQGIDDSTAGQFHHSLFLSSAQEIRPQWVFYSKRYVFAAMVALIGLGFGFTLANSGQMLTWIAGQMPQSGTPSIAMHNQKQAPEKPSVQSKEMGQSPSLKEQLPPLEVEPPKENVELTVQNQDVEEAPSQTEAQQADITPTEEQTSVQQANISPELLQRFEQALDQVDLDSEPSAEQAPSSQQPVPRIDQLPAWVMTRLPSMAFSAHMYASEPSQRWVRVNGTRMVEGDKIDGMIEIIRIEPQHVILNYSGQTFSMAALTDW